MERSQAARKKSAIATTFVALLRGVNVGGAKRLAMAALQSGNVVFDASADEGEAIAARARAPRAAS